MWGVLRRLRDAQDAHSAYLMFAALLLSLTLVVDILVHDTMDNRWLVWILLVFCLSGAVATGLLGRRVPRWIGLTSVFVFLFAQCYFLSLRDDPASVIASVQQLPVVAFYLGWFVRPRLARWIMAFSVVVFSGVMASNPLFHSGGAVGVPVAVHGILGMLFCFTAGMYLWRRQLRIASVDQLTGAFNRQGLLDQLDHQLRRRTVYQAPLSLVAIDFDGFKELNDTRGHAAGDLVLSRTVEAWQGEVRAGDVIARVGGDEFVLLLPRANTRRAQQIVERLRPVSEHSWSWGVAQAAPGESPAQLLARADAELYEWKRVRRERAREGGAQ